MPPHLTPVPTPDDAEWFTTIPVCATCPPGSLGFRIAQREQDWEITVWHEGPCPQDGETPTLIRVPGCPTCHAWDRADVSVSSPIPGRWAFMPKHGRTPITSRDGTIDTASGGEYCPRMELDNAVIDRLGRRQDGGATR